MDFSFDDLQRLLKDSIDRLLAGVYAFEQRAAYAAEPEGWSRNVWRSFAEMGLLGIPFAESLGGFDGGPAEIMIVMEAFGEHLVLEPYLPTVILGGGLVEAAGSKSQCEAFIPRIIAGELLMALAHVEPEARYDLNHVAATAGRDGDCWILDGDKRYVLGGEAAGLLVVSARISGKVDDEDGIALFLVDPAAPGVTRRGYRLQDHTRAADVWLAGVRVGADAVLGEPGGMAPVLARIVARAVAALCCEAVGAMSAAQTLTLNYLRTRKQFGQELGSFQALRHRAVDMYVQLELARSMAMHAVAAGGDDDLAACELAASAAKVQIGEAGRLVGNETIQMHGGIGMTEEYPAGHYYRKLTMIELLMGDSRHHRSQVARQGGLIPPAACVTD